MRYPARRLGLLRSVRILVSYKPPPEPQGLLARGKSGVEYLVVVQAGEFFFQML